MKAGPVVVLQRSTADGRIGSTNLEAYCLCATGWSVPLLFSELTAEDEACRFLLICLANKTFIVMIGTAV